MKGGSENDWITCGKEGQNCIIKGSPGQYIFRYGAKDKFVKKNVSIADGKNQVTIPCNNKTHGDPIYKEKKSCQFRKVSAPFSKQTTSGIRVTDATYGQNCGAKSGNVTRHLSDACNGLNVCNYKVDHRAIGDPVKGCPKAYDLSYQCDGMTKRVILSPEASGKTVKLECEKVNDMESIDDICPLGQIECDDLSGHVPWYK